VLAAVINGVLTWVRWAEVGAAHKWLKGRSHSVKWRKAQIT
jgi:hypothetical protein